MTTRLNRRNVLRGDLTRRQDSVMRPPGAQPDFRELCDDCGACSRACPEHIIRHSDQGGPEIRFALGACTFCGDCARACPTGALLVEAVEEWPWRAVVQTDCLSYRGISCRSCEDACEARAIRFKLQIGGRSTPILDQTQCTGCGECANICPAGAIQFERPQPDKMERIA